MTLTPEQEALVPEVSRALFKALTGGHTGRPKLIDLAAARAIIPLVYAAGRRAGREEALVALDGLPEPANRSACAAAIRNLSEQESGR